jgi:type IV pilus assembly protein PilQ
MKGAVAALLLALAGTAVADETRVETPCAAGSRYRGAKIDLDVKDADLHNLFRFLADLGNVSIVIPDDVKGTVTLRLRRVPWEQALCTVARVKKLDVTREGSIYYVANGG